MRTVQAFSETELPGWMPPAATDRGSVVESRDVALRALEVLAAAIAAESEDAAIAAARADLEVLDRPELLRVAVALAVGTSRQWVPAAHRLKLAQRVEHARLEITWAGS